jgi:dethiobiotin synthetase
VNPPPRYFVTATDTGVGKTQVSCALLSLMADAGLHPAAFKPYESGCEDLAAPADAVELKAAARTEDDLALICPHRFRLPLAPGVAARRLRKDPPFAVTMELFRAFDGRALVAEGAGGLLVPIDRRRDVIDLIAALELPVILVARSGLGTLNHTGLSLQALAARKLPVRAVVLSRSTPTADPSEKDNAALLAERHRVPVLGPVPFIQDPAARRAAFRRVLRPLVPGTLRRAR